MNTILGSTFVIALALFAAAAFRNIGLAMVFNPDALMIVCGGTTVAVFIAFPFGRLRSTVRDIADAFRHPRDRKDVSKDILDLAGFYRRSDIRGIENLIKTLKDDYLRLGAGLLTDHRDNETIRNIMERELAMRVMHANFSQNVLKTVARLTPSFGLAGTVISLIKMFKEMQSVDAMAPMMAVAMMSTFYGVIISNLFMLPLCAKLKERAILSEALMHITIEGIEAINNMEHPLRIQERINGYCEIGDLAPSGAGATIAVTKAAGA